MTVLQFSAAQHRHAIVAPSPQSILIYWWAIWLLACWPVFSTTKPKKSTGHRGNEGIERGP